MTELFNDNDLAERAREIGAAVLVARSMRMTDIQVALMISPGETALITFGVFISDSVLDPFDTLIFSVRDYL